ncbi:uncharacterized protein HKW66_Vig0167480 [Vigna angularis]|uniref:Uncharacterized protein n=1 Tax=Phaseolus angularis TaxID=3914 RepID=A0A8T0JSS1_PHAAN|nr:uncharacterized protein HKW66_Vig0167480 [Vigna angularis]
MSRQEYLHIYEEKAVDFLGVLQYTEGSQGEMRNCTVAKSFRGREKHGVEFGSAERAERVLGEPGVNAFHMEGVVATGNESSGLVGGDVVEEDSTFGGHEKVFSGDGGKLLELRGGEAGVGE